MMKELTKNEMKKISGTRFPGYIETTYDELVARFGEPYIAPRDDHKVDVEWIIDTPHGVATIYNYKNGYSYLGLSGLKVEEISAWHIGGRNNQSYEWIAQHVTTG